MYGAIGSIIN